MIGSLPAIFVRILPENPTKDDWKMCCSYLRFQATVYLGMNIDEIDTPNDSKSVIACSGIFEVIKNDRHLTDACMKVTPFTPKKLMRVLLDTLGDPEDINLVSPFMDFMNLRWNSNTETGSEFGERILRTHTLYEAAGYKESWEICVCLLIIQVSSQDFYRTHVPELSVVRRDPHQNFTDLLHRLRKFDENKKYTKDNAKSFVSTTVPKQNPNEIQHRSHDEKCHWCGILDKDPKKRHCSLCCPVKKAGKEQTALGKEAQKAWKSIHAYSRPTDGVSRIVHLEEWDRSLLQKTARVSSHNARASVQSK